MRNNSTERVKILSFLVMQINLAGANWTRSPSKDASKALSNFPQKCQNFHATCFLAINYKLLITANFCNILTVQKFNSVSAVVFGMLHNRQVC
jgi:hypothetical protein